MHRSSTETIIAALRILSVEIKSGDGIANAAIAEAAERMKELREAMIKICDESFDGFNAGCLHCAEINEIVSNFATKGGNDDD